MNSQKGFSLVELLVAAGLVSAIAVGGAQILLSQIKNIKSNDFLSVQDQTLRKINQTLTTSGDQALITSAQQSANNASGFNDCFSAFRIGNGSCDIESWKPFILTKPDGTPIAGTSNTNGVYFDQNGGSCTPTNYTTMEPCSFAAQAQYYATCPYSSCPPVDSLKIRVALIKSDKLSQLLAAKDLKSIELNVAPGMTSGSGFTDNIPRYNASGNLSPTFMWSDSVGNIGINTQTPVAPLQIQLLDILPLTGYGARLDRTLSVTSPTRNRSALSLTNSASGGNTWWMATVTAITAGSNRCASGDLCFGQSTGTYGAPVMTVHRDRSVALGPNSNPLFFTVPASSTIYPGQATLLTRNASIVQSGVIMQNTAFTWPHASFPTAAAVPGNFNAAIFSKHNSVISALGTAEAFATNGVLFQSRDTNFLASSLGSISITTQTSSVLGSGLGPLSMSINSDSQFTASGSLSVITSNGVQFASAGDLVIQGGGDITISATKDVWLNSASVIDFAGVESISAGTAVSVISDRRLKHDIRDLDTSQALDLIMSLRPVSYFMLGSKASSRPRTKHFGFIAQEVQKIDPDLVQTVDPESGYLGVFYQDLIAPIAKAIQEISHQLEASNDSLALLSQQSEKTDRLIFELKDRLNSH